MKNLIKLFFALIVAALTIPFGYCIGLFTSFLIVLMMAIPLFFLWNHVAPTYFTFLPGIWRVLPFWDVIWLSWTVVIIRGLVASVSITTNVKKSD